MSTTSVTAVVATRVPWRPRLVSAEFLKLRKRRALIISGFGLTVLPMLVAYTVLLSMHAARPEKHGPAGGLDNLSGSLDLLTTLGAIVAILIGATLGAGDLSAGVFRELVVTGRSRLALFAARIPAGLGLVWAIVGAGFVVTATASTVFAGSLEAPTVLLLVETAAWLALVTGLALVLALGVSSLIGSRGTTIGVVIGWQIAAVPLLLQIKVLGTFREVLPGAAIARLAPAALFDDTTSLAMSLPAAVLVIVAWTVVPLALGAWRTVTRDA